MLPQKVAELLKTKKVVFISDPQKVEYSFGGGKLKVWKEEIPYEKLLGVIFLKKPDKKPKVRKVPLILPPFELKNVETETYGEKEKLEILKDVCGYVGKYLQVYLKRYLGSRDSLGFYRVKRTFWGFVKRYKENHIFLESFVDCSRDEDIDTVKVKLRRYLTDAYSGYLVVFGVLTAMFGTLLAYELGLKIPSEVDLLLYMFLPAAYAMVNMLEIKEGVFRLNKYALIPLRGKVYTFINEFLYNDAFHEHFVFSLRLFKG